MNILRIQSQRTDYLLNGELLVPKDAQLFAKAEQQSSGTNQLGRGTAYFFEYAQRQLIMRHYRRGGVFRHILQNQYLYLSLTQTRMWQEFHLLSEMRENNLPVPNPVAARCVRTTWFSYTGSLVTEKIEDSQTLAQLLTNTSLTNDQWEQLGRVIAQFHNHNIYHADLNANNILITDSRDFYLIDFDKGKKSNNPETWAKHNIDRLHRSLIKIKTTQTPSLNFTQHNWQQLIRGHQNAFKSGS